MPEVMQVFHAGDLYSPPPPHLRLVAGGGQTPGPVSPVYTMSSTRVHWWLGGGGRGYSKTPCVGIGVGLVDSLGRGGRMQGPSWGDGSDHTPPLYPPARCAVFMTISSGCAIASGGDAGPAVCVWPVVLPDARFANSRYSLGLSGWLPFTIDTPSPHPTPPHPACLLARSSFSPLIPHRA